MFVIAVAAMMLFASATQGFSSRAAGIWEFAAAAAARGVHPVQTRVPGWTLISDPFELRPGYRGARCRLARAHECGAAHHRCRPGFQRPRYRDIHRHHGASRIRGHGRRASRERRVAAADGRWKGEARGAFARIALREPGPDLRFLHRRPCRDRIDRVCRAIGCPRRSSICRRSSPSSSWSSSTQARRGSGSACLSRKTHHRSACP